MWVAWFKITVLSDNLSNFWTIKPSPRFSWLTNKIIKMRDVMFTWIQMKIGNGRHGMFGQTTGSHMGEFSTSFYKDETPDWA